MLWHRRGVLFEPETSDLRPAQARLLDLQARRAAALSERKESGLRSILTDEDRYVETAGASIR